MSLFKRLPVFVCICQMTLARLRSSSWSNMDEEMLDNANAASRRLRDADDVLSDEGAFLSIRQLTTDDHRIAWERLWIPASTDTQSTRTGGRYQLTLKQPGFSASRTFSGAACASYEFTSSCNGTQGRNQAIAYVAEADSFGPFTNVHGFAAAGDASYDVPGKLVSSQCIGSTAQCNNQSQVHFVLLEPTTSYTVVLGYSGEENTACVVVSSYTTFDVNATECSSRRSILPPPSPLPGESAPADVYPVSPLPGQAVIDEVQLKRQQARGPQPEYRAGVALHNVSCLQLSMELSEESASSAAYFSASLIALPDYLSAIQNGTAASARAQLASTANVYVGNTDRAVIAESLLAGCTASQCNVTQGTWLQVMNLDPQEQYIVIQTPGSLSRVPPAKDELNTTSVYLIVQPYAAGNCPFGTASQAQSQSHAAWPLVNANGGVHPFAASSLVNLAADVVEGPANSAQHGADTFQAPQDPSSTSSRSTKIVAGVLGPVAGLALAAAAVLAFCVYRLRRPAWMMQMDEENELKAHSSTTQNLEISPLRRNREQGQPEEHSDAAATLNSSHEQRSQPAEYPIPSFSSRPKSLPESHVTAASAATSLSQTLSMWEIDIKTIKIICKLGDGGFGSVYKAVQGGGREVAVKMAHGGMQEVSAQRFWREVQLIADLRDKTIIQFYGAALTEDQAFLVTELMEGGDLYRALHDHDGDHLDSPVCWHRKGQQIIMDVAHGLFYLHSRDVVHLDLKSPNILLTRNYNSAKLGDVGLARTVTLGSRDPASAKSAIGTWDWAAPEALMGKHVSTACDCWSFGVVLHEVVTGEKPARGRLRSPRPEECPPEVAAVIKSCTSEATADRPSAREIITLLKPHVSR